MFCPGCGSDVPLNAAFCPQCGARRRTDSPSPSMTTAHPSPGVWSAPSGRTFTFDRARWRRGDRLLVAATSVAIVALVLPWFNISVDGIESVPGTSISALTAHGWMWLALLTMLATVAYEVAHAGGTLPSLPVAHWQILAAGSGLVAVLTFVGYGEVPSGYGHSVGAYIGLLAAVAAVIGAALVRADSGAGERARAAVACQQCHGINPAGSRFCESCGAGLTRSEGG